MELDTTIFYLKLSNRKKVLASIIFSLILVLFFLIIFPISPYTDLIALINLGFAPKNLYPYYQFPYSPTYMGFQIMVTIIQLFGGSDLKMACIFFTFFMFLILLISLFYFSTFLQNNNYYIFCILPAITFLLMHTTLFTTGTFPFIISSWISIIALFAYLKYYILSAKIEKPTNQTYVILSIFLGVLSGFMHPIGIEIYLIGMGFFIFLFIFKKKREKKNLFMLILPIAILSIYNYISLTYYKQITNENFQISSIFNFNLGERLIWIYSGGGYNTSYLFPERISIIEPYVITLLGILPFLCLLFYITILFNNYKQKKEESVVLALIAYLLLFFCLGIILVSDTIGSLCIVNTRLYAVATPLIIFTLYYILTENMLKNCKKLLYIGPLFTFLILISFIPVYSVTQEIIPFSNNLSNNLYEKIETIKNSLPEKDKDKPIILTVDMSKFGTGYHLYMIVPFIMANNKKLINEKIIIVCPWSADENKPKQYFNFNYIQKIDHLNIHWNTTSFPDMNITKMD